MRWLVVGAMIVGFAALVIALPCDSGFWEGFKLASGYRCR
jgi:hypothetical protein